MSRQIPQEGRLKYYVLSFYQDTHNYITFPPSKNLTCKNENCCSCFLIAGTAARTGNPLIKTYFLIEDGTK